MKKVVTGIDIGGTYTKFGIVDKNGQIYADGSIETSRYPDISSFIEKLSSEIIKMMKRVDSGVHLRGMGIGAPNGNYYKGTIEYAPNLNWKGIIPITRLLGDAFEVPVVLTNDANAAALGEMMYGGAGSMKDFIVITLGTGLGSGIVVNGNVVYGHDGFAGELGHVTVVEHGRECGCGRRGCLETYVSATGIRRTVMELMEEQTEDSVLRKISSEELTAKKIARAAGEGDRIALKAFERTGEMLGRSLANVVALFSPEAIFLLGGLANAGDLIFTPAREHMELNLMPIFKEKVMILPSGLTGNNPAVLGAAGLIWKELTG